MAETETWLRALRALRAHLRALRALLRALRALLRVLRSLLKVLRSLLKVLRSFFGGLSLSLSRVFFLWRLPVAIHRLLLWRPFRLLYPR